MKVSDLLESRAKGVTYTEKSAAGAVQKVIAELKGQTSASWTKISKDYIELDTSIKELEAQRNSLNAEIKDKATELFDAKDEVLTRVVETAQLTITLSKKVKKPATKKVDAEAVVRALIEADLVPELRKIVKAIIKANTASVAASTTPERLTVKRNVEESALSIRALISGLISKIKFMLKPFDSKFSRVQRLVNTLGKGVMIDFPKSGEDDDSWPHAIVKPIKTLEGVLKKS